MDLFQTELFDDSKEKLAALDDLFLRSTRYRNSRDYFNLLKFINRFPKLSSFNAFLIHTQNSGIEIVLSVFQWTKYGRTINYKAKPLVILVPFGLVSFVYDIADTLGDPIPPGLLNPFTTARIFKNTILYNTVRNCSKENIKCSEMQVLIKGDFSITINSSYSDNEKYSTSIHELAHIFCGRLGISKTSWWKSRITLNNSAVEIESESVPFLVCKGVGLQTSSESYFSTYIHKNKEIPSISFDTILAVSGYIEKMGTREFLSTKKK